MGSYFAKPPEPTILVSGLDCAGKTTLLYRVRELDPLPGIHSCFGPAFVSLRGCRFFDHDAHESCDRQSSWWHWTVVLLKQYPIQGMVFVIDSSEPAARICDAIAGLRCILKAWKDSLRVRENDCPPRIPILILLNKEDVRETPFDGMASYFGGFPEGVLDGLLHVLEKYCDVWEVSSCSALQNEGFHEGLFWLMKKVLE